MRIRIPDDFDGPSGIPLRTESAAWRAAVQRLRDDPRAAAQRDDFRHRRRTSIDTLTPSLERFLDGQTPLAAWVEELGGRYGGWEHDGGNLCRLLANQLGSMHEAFGVDIELTPLLRQRLRLPPSPEQARHDLDALHAYREQLLQAGYGSRRALDRNGLVVLLSAAWHAQDPERWPVHGGSTPRLVELAGLMEPAHPLPAFDYLQFRRAYFELAAALDLSPQEFECWAAAGLDVLRELRSGYRFRPPPPPQPRRRAWLIWTGVEGRLWHVFRTEGVAGLSYRTSDALDGFRRPVEMKAEYESVRHSAQDPPNGGLACFHFVHKMQPGDLVYAHRGAREILGRGTVTSDYIWQRNHLLLPHRRRVTWELCGTFRTTPRVLHNRLLEPLRPGSSLARDADAALEEYTVLR